jgi:3-hydroxyacyl-CoA dehydrogenase/enoyl-CoA hydratase/3-hydroxybutyryl-CoA epimerase
MMGSGIAYCCAMSGMETVLKDVSDEAAAKGKAYSENILKKRGEQRENEQRKSRWHFE